MHTVFFAETEGVPAQFAFDTNSPTIEVYTGKLAHRENINLLYNIKLGTEVAARVKLADGSAVQIVVLDQKSSLALWKGNFQGHDRIFLTHADLVLDKDNLRLTSMSPADLKVAIYPAPISLVCNGSILHRKTDGVFECFTPPAPSAIKLKVAFELLKPAGPPREIALGKIEQPVAAAPQDADFEHAAVWRIVIPEIVDLGTDPSSASIMSVMSHV